MTHPVRLALLDALQERDSLTATQASELIGEPPNTCSFHFRQLAKYGFVEEAGPAPGRSRPWKLTNRRMHFSDVHEDPATLQAARGLERLLRETYFARIDAFYESRAEFPVEWQEVSGSSQAVLHLTPEELRAVDREIMAILDRYQIRSVDEAQRSPASLPVEVVWFGYPRHLPGPSGQAPAASGSDPVG